MEGRPPKDLRYDTRRFLEWFKALPGATFSDAIQIADLRHLNAGRGIVAIRDIPTDETLFTIPRRSIINTDNSDLPRQLPHLFAESNVVDDEEQQLDSWSGLTLVLIYEYLRGESSFWKPYIDLLPSSFETPIFWSDSELSQLQASALPSKIGKDVAEKLFRDQIIPAIRSEPNIFRSSGDYSDEELVQLAHQMGSTIMAYAFDLENDDEDDAEEDDWVEDREGTLSVGMIPMADMLNADAEFNVFVNHGDEHLTVTALRPIKAGEEILNYYGPHPNSELLRRYGYVTEKHSRYDIVEIPWATVTRALTSHLGISSEILQQTLTNLDDDDELEDSFVLERESKDPNSDGTLTGSASITNMPAELLQQLGSLLKALGKTNEGPYQEKRKRNETLMSILADSVSVIETRYATTAAEDEALLQTKDLTLRHRMAIQVRLGEKRLLSEARAFLLARGAGPDGESCEGESRKKMKQFA